MKINLTAKQKASLIRHAVRAALYCIATGGMFLILSSIFGGVEITITLNWVKFLFGAILVAAGGRLLQWLYPVRRVPRKEVNYEYFKK